jgi:hypothetical protein
MSYIDTIQKACPEGKRWAIEAGIQSDAEAWDKLQRAHWMLWLVEERGIKLNPKKLHHFAADCAEDVLSIYEKLHPGDDRPRKSIQAARDCANGKIKTDVRISASAAASTASREATSEAAEYAARSAADASAWEDDDPVEATSWAVVDAAEAVSSYVASSDGEDAADAAKNAAMKTQADRLRKYFQNPFVGKP